MKTYSELKADLHEITMDTVGCKKKMVSALGTLAATKTALDGMASKYQATITDIEFAASSMPEDRVVQITKEEKDKLVADFLELLGKVEKARSDLAATIGS